MPETLNNILSVIATPPITNDMIKRHDKKKKKKKIDIKTNTDSTLFTHSIYETFSTNQIFKWENQNAKSPAPI